MIVAKFKGEVRTKFKRVIAIGCGLSCGSSGTDLCTAAAVKIKTVTASARRASGIAVSFEVELGQVPQGQQAAKQTAFSTYLASDDFTGDLQSQGGALADLSGVDVTVPPDIVIQEPAPPIVTSIECYSAAYSIVMGGGLHKEEISHFGWEKADVYGFVKAPVCPITYWPVDLGGVSLHTTCNASIANGGERTQMSTATTKVTCTSSDPSVAASCVDYKTVITATQQSGHNLKYYLHVAGCDDLQVTCPQLHTKSAETIAAKSEPAQGNTFTVESCNTCTGNLCNAATWPPAVPVTDTSTGGIKITAVIGLFAGVTIIAIVFCGMLKSIAKVIKLYGPDAMKEKPTDFDDNGVEFVELQSGSPTMQTV